MNHLRREPSLTTRMPGNTNYLSLGRRPHEQEKAMKSHKWPLREKVSAKQTSIACSSLKNYNQHDGNVGPEQGADSKMAGQLGFMSHSPTHSVGTYLHGKESRVEPTQEDLYPFLYSAIMVRFIQDNGLALTDQVSKTFDIHS